MPRPPGVRYLRLPKIFFGLITRKIIYSLAIDPNQIIGNLSLTAIQYLTNNFPQFPIIFFFLQPKRTAIKTKQKINKLPKKRPYSTSILYKRDILPSYSEIGGLLSDINVGRFKRQKQFKTTSASQSSRFLIIKQQKPSKKLNQTKILHLTL